MIYTYIYIYISFPGSLLDKTEHRLAAEKLCVGGPDPSKDLEKKRNGRGHGRGKGTKRTPGSVPTAATSAGSEFGMMPRALPLLLYSALRATLVLGVLKERRQHRLLAKVYPLRRTLSGIPSIQWPFPVTYSS